MSFDDFADFMQDERDTAEPPDGQHTATLTVAKVNRDRDSGRVKQVILEWQTTDLAYYWTSFHPVSKGARVFTKRTLDGLGIDLEEIAGRGLTSDEAWDVVAQGLADAEDTTYTVRVGHNGKFLNLDVVGKPEVVQQELPVEVPPTPVKASAFDDEDIPF